MCNSCFYFTLTISEAWIWIWLWRWHDLNYNSWWITNTGIFFFVITFFPFFSVVIKGQFSTVSAVRLFKAVPLILWCGTTRQCTEFVLLQYTVTYVVYHVAFVSGMPSLKLETTNRFKKKEERKGGEGPPHQAQTLMILQKIIIAPQFYRWPLDATRVPPRRAQEQQQKGRQTPTT